ncbi:MAG: hypothetical protein NC313_11700 [Butyrivibrio sp.]|nr:hypothetical protein [Butyrivibrio sp.]
MDKIKKKASYTFCVNLFLAVTLLVFGPMEIFIYNSSDFQFTFSDFWYILALFALGYIIIATFFLSLLPEKLCEMFAMFLFAFTVCCYLQAMFLNGKMQVMVGYEIAWGTSTKLFNLAIWLCIFGLIFAARHYLKENYRKTVQFLSLALTAVQLVALIFLLFTTDVLTEKKNGYISDEKMLELSAGGAT